MNDSWRRYSNGEVWQRIRWARQHMTPFERPTDAARSLGIKPGTYRTYERPKEDDGRVPPLNEIQHIARKFKVSWVWLAAGEGHVTDGVVEDERIRALSDQAARLPEDKRSDALDAALSVLESYVRKAG